MNRRSFVARMLGGIAAALVPFAPRRKGQEQREQVEAATPTCECACCCEGVELSFCEVTISELNGESQRATMIWDPQRNVWQIIQIECP